MWFVPDPAERRAGEDADAGLVEQPVGQLGAGQPGPGDVREDVERAVSVAGSGCPGSR